MESVCCTKPVDWGETKGKTCSLDNDPDGFPCHNANSVNNGSDDDGYDGDDDCKDPSDGAGAVDAADYCGNEHVDKA